MISKIEKSHLEYLLKNGNDNTVAKQFGVTRQAVYKMRKKFQIPPSKIPSKRTQILELRRDGASVSKISIIVEKSQSYIYKILRIEAYGGRVNPPDKNS
jgi:transposase